MSLSRTTTCQTLSLVLAALLLAASCTQKAELPPPAPRKPAPSFELKDSSGQLRKLQDFKGQLLLLHFWASWCPPCIEEIPRWIASAPAFKGMPIKLVAITVDEKWEEALKVFPVNRLAPNMLLLHDPTSDVARSFGTKMFPETYLVNGDLEVVEKWIGSQDWSGSRVRFAIARALSTATRPASSPRK